MFLATCNIYSEPLTRQGQEVLGCSAVTGDTLHDCIGGLEARATETAAVYKLDKCVIGDLRVREICECSEG